MTTNRKTEIRDALEDGGVPLEELRDISERFEHMPEGLIIPFEALQRMGKTLAMTIFAVDAWQNGRSIFSTIQLGIPHEPLEFIDLKLEDGSKRFWNGHIACDELNFLFDARASMSKVNRQFGAQLLQQKKQGCNLTGTTHSLDYLDLRFRQNYDYCIRPKVYPVYPAKPEFITLTIDHGPTQKYCHKKLKMPVAPYLGLYDTGAVYDPFKAAREQKIRDEIEKAKTKLEAKEAVNDWKRSRTKL